MGGHKKGVQMKYVKVNMFDAFKSNLIVLLSCRYQTDSAWFGTNAKEKETLCNN